MGLDDLTPDDESDNSNSNSDNSERPEYIQDMPKCPVCGLMGVNRIGVGYNCDNQNCDRDIYG